MKGRTINITKFGPYKMLKHQTLENVILDIGSGDLINLDTLAGLLITWYITDDR